MVLQPFHISSRPQNLGPKITLWNVPSQVYTWKHSPDLPGPHMKNLPPKPLRLAQNIPSDIRSAFENSVRTQTKLHATRSVEEPRTSLASVWARKSCLLSIICRNTQNIDKQENPSPNQWLSLNHFAQKPTWQLWPLAEASTALTALISRLPETYAPPNSNLESKTNLFTRVPNSLPPASAQLLHWFATSYDQKIMFCLHPPEPSVRRDLA